MPPATSTITSTVLRFVLPRLAMFGLPLVVALSCCPVLAGQPSSDGLGNTQELDIQAAPPIAGAGIAFDFDNSYFNVLGLPPRPPRENVIHWPKGVVWNGALFPQCDPALLLAQGPVACPPNSEFLTGEGTAAIVTQLLSVKAEISGFVGTPLHGHPTQIFYVKPQLGPIFVLTGEIVDEPEGPYGLAEHLDLSTLPGGTALNPSPIVLTAFHTVDLHTTVTQIVDGREVSLPLTMAPPICEGFWYYAIDSVYRVGAPLRSTSRQPCVPAS